MDAVAPNRVILMFCSQCGVQMTELAKFCGGCGAPKGGSPTQNRGPKVSTSAPNNVARTIFGVIGGLLLFAVIAGRLFGPHAGGPSQGVTRAEYNAIQTGMTYEQVREIIGSAGEEIAHSDLAGYTTVMYAWKNWNGSNMNAMFQNGQLVNKAQFGLP